MPISKKVREDVYKKYEGHCAYCGRKIAYKDMQVDHFMPLRAWGIEDEDWRGKKMKQKNWVKCKNKLPEVDEDVLLCFDTGEDLINMAVGFLKEVSDEGQHWCAYVDAGYYTDCDTAPSHWKSLPNNPIRHT